MIYRNNQTRLRQALALLPALALGLPPIWAEERAPATGPSRETNQAPVRTVQLDSHGRYPFGQYRGGYRYPYAYPYYRYGGPRHYPYSFGVGPYGPYGSNYGGYSGNAYDPRVYRRPPSNGQPLPDAPPAPLPDVPAPPARAPRNNPVDAEEGPRLGVPARPIPNEDQAGDPIPYLGGNPYDPSFGGARTYGMYPPGSFANTMWFGQNKLIQGFGYYPTEIYNHPYGPPSGLGYYSPEFAPQCDNLNTRNYGPAYPTPGGINGGLGYYQGW